MDLILVRHALPERADGDDATADPPLAPLGVKQAEATADFLTGETIDHIVTSPLQRARQTAERFAARTGLSIEVVEELREIDPFGGSYVPAEEMTVDHPVIQDLADDIYALFAGAGGFAQFRSVVVTALDAIVEANRGRTVAVFCHGTVIGCYLSAVLGHDDPFVLLPDYCGIYRLKASGQLRTLRSANETGHVRDLLQS